MKFEILVQATRGEWHATLDARSRDDAVDLIMKRGGIWAVSKTLRVFVVAANIVALHFTE